MATSSSNKMPLLVDRPLHSFATLGGAAALTDATNFNTPNGGGCVLLVDCLSNDGAVVDSLSIVANEANTTASTVLIFLSIAASGTRTNISLPPLTVPVPNIGGLTSVSETDKKNTGLYVPSGAVLYAGVSAALAAPSSSTRVHVFAQGGFF